MTGEILSGFDISKDMVVLDVGCSYGSDYHVHLLSSGVDVYGIDKSSGDLLLGTENGRLGRQKVKCADFTDCELGEWRGKFDRVLCMAIIDYLSPFEERKLYFQLHRALKQDGRCYIDMPVTIEGNNKYIEHSADDFYSREYARKLQVRRDSLSRNLRKFFGSVELENAPHYSLRGGFGRCLSVPCL